MEIKYTEGKITPKSNGYAELVLYNKRNVVYKASIPMNEMDVIIVMNKNIIKDEVKRKQ